MPVEFWDNMKDLIVLVADKNMQFLIQGLLPRIPRIERLKEFSFDSIIHLHRDPGIYNEADETLRPLADKYGKAMVVLDHSGCGREEKTRTRIESDIEKKMFQSGWQNRACAIAIQPELENWIWVNERRIREAIGWDADIDIYEWLHQNKWKETDAYKPRKPKEAFEAALRKCHTPRSSSIYKEIVESASYSRCLDPAFRKMINQIKTWFGNEDEA